MGISTETTLLIDQNNIKTAVAFWLSQTTGRPVRADKVTLKGDKAIAVVKDELIPQKRPRRPRRGISVRRPEERESFDAQVLALFNEQTNIRAAEDLRLELGQHGLFPTGMQLRASLHRLIESGRLTREGQARGTFYVLAPATE